MSKELIAVSLFCGAGGMDVGFENAGITISVANEIDKYAAATYQANHTNQNMLIGDINSFMEDFKAYKGADIVFGGPPCQGFSVAGKMDPSDDRSKLIWSYLDAVEIISPKVFVMENVKALAQLDKWENVRKKYIKRATMMGYYCSFVVLNAADYGVPQNRERVFFIGSKKNIDFQIFLNNLKKYKTEKQTLREVLLSLPPIGSEKNPNTCTAKITLASHPVLRKSPYAGMIFNGMGRPVNLNSVSNTLPASMGGNKTPIIDEDLLRNKDGEDWVTDYHRKLMEGKIKAEFKVAPPNLRRMSILEASTIQTFPPNYIFKGNKGQVYCQIGNAVPCKLAESVANAVIETYFGNNTDEENKKMTLKEKAKIVLEAAYRESKLKTDANCSHKDFIDFVIHNSHKTYKYVLFTELLSKATDESINTLCLQKKSTLPGAYDARTICHKVIVPFEMEVLNKVLGGSNEPFLNKPARFTELNKTNAVRKGNDQNLLNSLCDNLPLIETKDDAYECLVYLLCELNKIMGEQSAMDKFVIPEESNLPSKLFFFINKCLDKSFEGEMLTLMVAGIYHLIFNGDSNEVEVHPVNQSGASGREVSDLDIYDDGMLILSNELKDKNYYETDVRHAADKVMAANGYRMLFIEGPRAMNDGTWEESLIEEYRERNFMLSIVPYDAFFSTTISMIQEIDCYEFIKFIMQSARDKKFKEETINYIDSLSQEILLLNH